MSDEQVPDWQWISSSEFEAPATPTVIAIKRWWHSVQAQWPLHKDAEDTVDNDQTEITIDINVDDAAQTLEQQLSDWLSDSEDNEPRWIICPPHSPAKAAALAWIKRQGLAELTPPERDQLTLSQLSSDIDAPEAPWFLAELAHSFMRQSKGLRWVRAFFAQVLSGELGKGVVVCDSWAWSFLQQLWPMGAPRTLTLKAFGDEQLYRLGLHKDPQQLKHLAALSRGNPGVASVYANSRYRRLANRQQSPFEMPSLPKQTTDETAFILHSLLLHSGLSRYQLQQVLSIISPNHLDIELQSLRRTGLIECHDKQWQVTARGYPVVRAALATRGLWLDQF